MISDLNTKLISDLILIKRITILCHHKFGSFFFLQASFIVLQLFLISKPELDLITNLPGNLFFAEYLEWLLFSLGLLSVLKPVQVSLEISILDVGLIDLILFLDAVPLEMEDKGGEHPVDGNKSQGKCKPGDECPVLQSIPKLAKTVGLQLLASVDTKDSEEDEHVVNGPYGEPAESLILEFSCSCNVSSSISVTP